MAALNASKLSPELWEVAKTWRDGGTAPVAREDATSDALPTRVAAPAHGDGTTLPAGDSRSCCCCYCEAQVVSLAMLRTCSSPRYGVHIPRMFRDLLVDLGQAFAARGAAARSGVGFGETEAGGVLRPSTPPNGEKPREFSGEFSEETSAGKACEAGGARRCSPSPPVFHVTEYDVTRGRYPVSWGDHAGYIVPGGVASACGGEPWMMTLLAEVKGLQESGRPVLAVCLGHQVIAQALGGSVRPRAGPRKHYALQESQLLLAQQSSGKIDAVRASVQAVQQQRKGGVTKHGGVGEPPRMRLLYHHNDEVVELPPGATNISTSRHCSIHGMLMTKEGEEEAMAAMGGEELPRPNILTFQAHPELNYEYGRRVMDGILDGDVEAGRLTHEKARRLKEQVSAWDHEEFPVALELMRRLFEPIVLRRHGGSM